MMCSTRLIWWLPARDSRWRTWSPQEASVGAVPFGEAKWALLGNLVTSPASTSSRAAPDGPIACRSVKVVPVARGSALRSVLASFLRWQVRSRSLISSAATRRRALPAASRGGPGPAAPLPELPAGPFVAPPGISPAPGQVNK